jgi:translation elongation factor EF-Tu-like GTPase
LKWKFRELLSINKFNGDKTSVSSKVLLLKALEGEAKGVSCKQSMELNGQQLTLKIPELPVREVDQAFLDAG